jgi:sugar phosphate permease
VPQSPSEVPAESPVARAAYARASARLLPLLFACYIVAYLDRVNIGFAKLQMSASLELSDAAYGFGAGIFFIGYFVFEVPSNLLLERFGARRWIARIMITWGIVSGAFSFVAVIPWGPLPALVGVPPHVFSFYALRLLLGVAEAGFFPGIILYLTYWFPAERRGRTIALFATAVAVANVIGAPASGALMQYLDGASGWPGWRWLLVVEAVPSIILGVVVLLLLPDGPRAARWLSDAEREAIVARVEADTIRVSDARDNHNARAAFGNWRVWALAFVYLTSTFALYGVNFWMPTLIQEMGVGKTDYFRIGLIGAIPWGIAGVVMVLCAAHSDRTGERRWHAATGLLVTSAGLVTLALVGNAPVVSILALSLITSGVLAFIATFWPIPTAFLRGSAAAAGIAWINSIGNLGGHFGPDLIGRIRTATNSSANAFVTLAILAAAGAAMTLVASDRRRLRDISRSP